MCYTTQGFQFSFAPTQLVNGVDVTNEMHTDLFLLFFLNTNVRHYPCHDHKHLVLWYLPLVF